MSAKQGIKAIKRAPEANCWLQCSLVFVRAMGSSKQGKGARQGVAPPAAGQEKYIL